MTEICPRCDNPVVQEFYGPCADCRSALHALKAPKPTDRQHAKEQQVAMAARLKRFLKP